MSELLIRAAAPGDVPALGRLGAALLQLHHTTDPLRFFMPDAPEAGYSWWFGRELENPDAVILVAELKSVVVGYTYARLEERDWNMLLDAHGALHDLYVVESARRRGAGAELLSATLAELDRRGAPRVVLSTMVTNQAAQRVFARFGFRPTMLEMTRERGG